MPTFSATTFDELALDPYLQRHLSSRMEIARLTPVQQHAIPALLSGGDLSANASDGGVSLVQNSRAQATGNLDLKGGTTVSLTDASAEAGGDLTLTGEDGNVTLANSQATGAEDDDVEIHECS